MDTTDKHAQPETTDDEETSFEENLGRLEDIVESLEQGDLPLEDALEMYEEGVAAYRDCHQKLESAESKVIRLVETLEGELEEEPFEQPDEDD